jgi:predicted N-acyltransferase
VAEIELLQGVAAVPREEWNALVGEGSPFLEWEWLASLEESGAIGGDTGWAPRPLVVRDAGRLVAACPLYLKAHSEGEFVFDFAWAEAAERAGISYYPKLLVGVPFTPVGGARFLTLAGAGEPARAALVEQLGQALRELCLSNSFSSVHVNFCLEDEIAPLERAGFELRVGLQYHWRNEGFASFEDYLARFRSKRRNQIRRERREMDAQEIRIEALRGDAIPDEVFARMFRFYLSTVRQRVWGRQYLNRELFELARERLRHRLLFVVAWQREEPIAGTFNLEKAGVLYGRYWGAAREVRHLHFNVCYYAAIEHAIRSGLERFEPGAGGDYKQLRGFDAQPTYSLHFLADPRLRGAVSKFLAAERAEADRAIGWLREKSALKPQAP